MDDEEYSCIVSGCPPPQTPRWPKLAREEKGAGQLDFFLFLFFFLVFGPHSVVPSTQESLLGAQETTWEAGDQNQVGHMPTSKTILHYLMALGLYLAVLRSHS